MQPRRVYAPGFETDKTRLNDDPPRSEFGMTIPCMKDTTDAGASADAAAVKARGPRLDRTRGPRDAAQHALEIARTPTALGRADTAEPRFEIVVLCHYDPVRAIDTDKRTPMAHNFQLAAPKPSVLKRFERDGGTRNPRAAMKKDVQTRQ